MEIVEVLLGCKSELLGKFLSMPTFKNIPGVPKINGPIREIFYEPTENSDPIKIIIVPIKGLRAMIKDVGKIPGVIFMEPVRSKETYEDVEY